MHKMFVFSCAFFHISTFLKVVLTFNPSMAQKLILSELKFPKLSRPWKKTWQFACIALPSVPLVLDKNSPTSIGLKRIFKTPHNSKISISRKKMRNILKHVLLTRRFKGFLSYSLKEKSLYIKKKSNQLNYSF